MTDLTRGDVLAERYVLQDPVPSDIAELVCWTAEDQILGRLVHVSLVSGPRRTAALDEARRASLVADPRLTRVLEPGMVVTIEPGLYFIDMLLDALKDKGLGPSVNWDRVAQFKSYGGIRIEDDVVCTEGDPENLTREAFAAA